MSAVTPHSTALWSAETRVVAAVSGGSDSVALFFLLRELAAAGDLQLAGLAHLHHHIRGAAADEDAAFCRALAARAGVAAAIGDADVPALAGRERLSIEVAGRNARQEFFRRGAGVASAGTASASRTRATIKRKQCCCGWCAARGRRGCPASRPGAITSCARCSSSRASSCATYLESIGESWREDATNQDRANPRNRIRHEILPLLRELNPRADAALARTANILRSDAELFAALANEAGRRFVRTIDDGRVAVAADGLAGLPRALARRVALVALETVNPGQSYGLEEADHICAACQGTLKRGARPTCPASTWNVWAPMLS